MSIAGWQRPRPNGWKAKTRFAEARRVAWMLLTRNDAGQPGRIWYDTNPRGQTRPDVPEAHYGLSKTAATEPSQMADRPDRQDRKDKLHVWRAQRRAEARQRLPLPDAQMQALFDMLDQQLPTNGCDHTLRLVREWAEQFGVDFEALSAWCHENSGHCGCEVLANCEERWQDANRDVNW